MIKTIEINDSILAAFKALVGTCEHTLSNARRGYRLDLHPQALNNWAHHYLEEVADVARHDINYCGTAGLDDLIAYTVMRVNDAITNATGWTYGQMGSLSAVLGPSRGSSSGLYLFTAPVSNTTWETYAVWADDANEAIEELQSEIESQADDGEDAAHQLELVLSSPAYCLQAE